MPIELSKVIPLGRSFAEYVKMFNLNQEELKLKILDCAAGPSSFNYEANVNGGRVISIDPIYEFSADEIRKRIDETFEDIMSQAEKNMDRFVWQMIKNVQELRDIRKKAMDLFIWDFERGKKESRYLTMELPELGFDDLTFDIALCSHFLFLYSEILSYEFHQKSISEMLRVSKEIRIFPLVDLNSKTSDYVSPIIDYFSSKGYNVQITTVDYHFLKGANQLLTIKR